MTAFSHLAPYIASMNRVRAGERTSPWRIVLRNHAQTEIIADTLPLAIQRALDFKEMCDAAND